MSDTQEEIMLWGEELQEKTVIEIGKFAILWGAFEKNVCRWEKNDKKVEKLLSKSEEIENVSPCSPEKLKKFAEKLKERVEYCGNGNISKYVESLSPNCSYGQSDIEGFISSKGQGSFAGALVAIYRIRNNMFHGSKVLKELDRQNELFKAANKVLEEIFNSKIALPKSFIRKRICFNRKVSGRRIK